MKITMIVAAHKASRLPEDSLYFPLHVGKAGKNLELGIPGDDTGDSISLKNASFCELTGIYWAWKNLDADYIGLSHYRRYFCAKRSGDKWASLLTLAQAEELLAKSSVILPKKRRYYIETVYNQYIHAHPAEPLDLALELVSQQSEAYAQAAAQLKKRSWTHIYNMFLMRRDLFDRYCQWLFDILFQVEAAVDISGYSSYDSRVFGFLSERLLDVWITANGIDYIELPVLYMDKQNWLKKGSAFLRRKLLGSRS